MKVLILGGTRFVGKKLASELLLTGVDVTITSRKEIADFPINRQIISERENLSPETFLNLKYDFVLDFTGYKADQIAQLPKSLQTSNYLLMSTSWIGRKCYSTKGGSSLESLSEGILTPAEGIYVEEKLKSEIMASEVFGKRATIVRLPMVIGQGDHHRRLEFYANRLTILKRPFLVNDGTNQVHTVLVEDVVKLLTDLLDVPFDERPPLINFTPPSSIPLRALIMSLAAAIGQEARFTSIRSEEFAKSLPILAKVEPFWREVPCDSIGASIWSLLATKPTPWEVAFRKMKFDKQISEQQMEAMLEEKEYLDGNS